MTENCKETGWVTRLAEDGLVWVKIQRAEACQSCSAKSACAVLGGQTKEMVIKAKNTVRARPGDQVTLTLPENRVISASAVLYLLPAVGLLAGALGGQHLTTAPSLNSDTWAIVGAAVGLLFGFGLSTLLGRKMGKGPKYIPSLSSVIESD